MITSSKPNQQKFGNNLNNNLSKNNNLKEEILQAIANNALDLVKKLVTFENINVKVNSSQYPYVYAINNAIHFKNIQIIGYLLDSGAGVNLPDRKGSTALHLAFGAADSEIIRLVLDRDECNLNLKNVAEETPLDILISAYLRENRTPDEDLLERAFQMGARFGMPLNFEINSKNNLIFLTLIKTFIKTGPKLRSLFLSNDPILVQELILNGYWRNSLIIAIKSIIYEMSFKVLKLSFKEWNSLFFSIQLILFSNEFNFKESDLCSSFKYMLDEKSSSATEEDIVNGGGSLNVENILKSTRDDSDVGLAEHDLIGKEDVLIVKLMKTILNNPPNLQNLCRILIRDQLAKNNQQLDGSLSSLNVNNEYKRFILFKLVNIEKQKQKDI